MQITNVNEEDEELFEQENEKNGILNFNLLDFLIGKATKKSIGLPCAVQVVTKSYKEELCLQLMKLIYAENDCKQPQNVF